MPRLSYVTLLTIGLQLINGVQGKCTWPLSLRFSTWLDSSHDKLHFNDTTMFGWRLNVDGNSYSPVWQCVYFNRTTNKTILESTDPVKFKTFKNEQAYVYLCLTIKQVTDISYRYYVNCAALPALNNERGILLPKKAPPIENNFCLDVAIAEYRMLIKLENVSTAAVDCPRSIQGSFSYKTESPPRSTICNSTSSASLICTSKKHVQFHNGPCSTKVAYSVSGALLCVENLELGDTSYVMMYNYKDLDKDIDNKEVFRFICLAVSSNSSKLSISPMHCHASQTPYTSSTSLSGSAITLEALSVTSDVGVIWPKYFLFVVGGACGGVLVLVGAFVNLVIYCRRKKQSRNIENTDLSFSVQDRFSSFDSIHSEFTKQIDSDVYINLQELQRPSNVATNSTKHGNGQPKTICIDDRTIVKKRFKKMSAGRLDLYDCSRV